MSRRRGFTLLEVLVVLIITAMISAVLMQALSFLLTIRTGVLNKIIGLEKTTVTRNLYLAPLQGLVPDFPERPNIFAGTDRQIHGLTTSPIQNRPGAPVGFEMYFDYAVNDGETRLIYHEVGREPIILGGWAGNTGAFSYRNRTGDWTTAWPPLTVIGERATQTPWAIRIEMGTGFPSAVVTSVTGIHDRMLRMEDSVMGSDIRTK